jgi:outer membrane lipoprotein carrier protein
LIKQYYFLLLLTIITSLTAKEISISPFKASFVQTVTNTNNISVKYKGDIFLDKNNNILWKYKTPTIKNIYITGNSIVIEEPELEQAILTTLDDKLNLSVLLSKATHIKQNIYKANMYNTNYTILLNKNKIRQIQYKDQLDNKIVISFFSVKTNPKFDNNLFIFKSKANYDIIHK